MTANQVEVAELLKSTIMGAHLLTVQETDEVLRCQCVKGSLVAVTVPCSNFKRLVTGIQNCQFASCRRTLFVVAINNIEPENQTSIS